MEIRRLTSSDAQNLKPLYSTKKYMGVSTDTNTFVGADKKEFLELAYNVFCDTYLSGLNNYSAFGVIEDGEVTSMISAYQSPDNPEWYWTQIRSNNANGIKPCLDSVLKYQEASGRLKFYTMFNAKYKKSWRRFAFSEYNSERYGYFDEYMVPAKTKCLYMMPWFVLYNRTLLPVDSIVRTTFLKQEYREQLAIGGNI